MARDSEAKDRRLAAIVFTDIVGFSARVNRDERAGARALDLQRRVVRRLIPGFGGREIETAGDSFLLVFSSAFAALRCLIAIQQTLHREQAEAAAGEPVLLRTSLHLGDIELRGREIFGDGVNVAARLMPLSPEGGIAMSDQVHSQLRHRLDVEPRSLGPCELKNIRHPVEVFVLDAATVATLSVGGGRSGPQERRQPPSTLRRAAPALAGVLVVVCAGLIGWRLWPSLSSAADSSTSRHRIAVLPFASFSSGEDDALLAAGLQDSILTGLARLPQLQVISRTSVSAYEPKNRPRLSDIAAALRVGTLLEGSLQRKGNRVLVQAQLIDAATDQHLWAQAYDRQVDDLFAVEAEIAEQVAAAVHVSLTQAERSSLQRTPGARPENYGLYLKAQRQMDVDPSENGLRTARADLDKVLAEDPEFALGHVAMARLHLCYYALNLDRNEARLQQAHVEIVRAQSLAPEASDVHLAWGNYYLYGQRDLATAEAEYRAAVRLAPNSAVALSAFSEILSRRGELDDALISARRAVDLDPRSAANYTQVYGVLRLMRDLDGASRTIDMLAGTGLAPDDYLRLLRTDLAMMRGDLAAARRQAGADASPEVLQKIAYYAGDLDDALRQTERMPAWQDIGAGYPRETAIAYYAWLKGDARKATAMATEAAAKLRVAIATPDEGQWQRKGTLAVCEAILGHAEAAEHLLSEVRGEFDQHDPVARNNVLSNEIGTYAVLGRDAEALASLRELVARPSLATPQLLLHDPILRHFGKSEAAASELLATATAREPLEL